MEAAMLRLGARVLSAGDRAELRQEPLGDTLRSINGYVDLIALRHPSHSAVLEAVQSVTKPVINCGTGSFAHPTQTLVDLYFILKMFGRLDGIRLLLLGDFTLRAARSLLAIGPAFGMKIDVCHPKFDDDEAFRHGIASDLRVATVKRSRLPDILSEYEVVYVKPISAIDYESGGLEHNVTSTASQVLIDRDMVMRYMRPDAILLHALPRFGELDPAIDGLPQAKYFELAQCAVYPRMAVIDHLMQKRRDCRRL
jgi:aspartate carbamoyltransferase catalytic subunit